MEYCLLCLKNNKGILNSIKVDSVRWQELNISKVIEKHFWPLSTIHPSSWICVPCWQEVDEFHKFYMRIEEAHVIFGKINDVDAAACKEEMITHKMKVEDTSENADNLGFWFLEPEILINQPHDITKSEIFATEPSPVDIIENKESSVAEHLDEKILIIQNEQAIEDPLQKSAKSKSNKLRSRKNPKDKASTEIKIEDIKGEKLNVKEEPMSTNDDNDDFQSDTDNDYQSDKNASETADNKRTTRKENDKFISEHFKQIFCDLCQEPFDDFPAIQKHFIENHKQRGYVVCCKKKFFVRARLIDHIHCHLNPDHYKCDKCGKVMSNRRSFVNHMLLVHRANEVVKQHCCDVCGKSFIKPSVLRIHKLTHLPEEEKKFPCNDCGKNYGSQYLLNQHKQTVHLKRFVKICYICGKAINSSTEFKVHMNKHEGIPAPVISCDVCGLLLTTERGLKRHKDSQHPVGGKREHPCPICPKISPTLKALRKHINTMHKKGVDHKCNICEKTFRRSETLKEHMASHTGITLYTCPWCPKTFNSNGNMHAHRKKIHPKEYEELKLQKYLQVL